MKYTLAVQPHNNSSWHAAQPGGRMTACGQRRVNGDWAEYKPYDKITDERLCKSLACQAAWAGKFDG